MHDDSKVWLEYARQDLKAGAAQAGSGEDLWFDVCFHAQQAAEKCLKALIVHKSKMYPKTHKLLDLLGFVNREELNGLREELAYVDKFYVPSRYPTQAIPTADGIPATKEEGERALEIANRVYKITEEIIASEIKPG